MVEHTRTGYQRLVEIRVLHHYWLDEGATTFDDIADAQARTRRLLRYDARQFVGITPVRFGTRAGTHTVRLELSGYAPYSTDVTLGGGRSLPVDLSLSGNAPQPQSVVPTPAPPAVTVTTGTLSDRLGLNLYPGANLRKLEQDGGKLKAQFETAASLEQVYDDLHRQLTDLGWQRTLLQTKDAATKVEADYARGGQGLDLKLDQEGKSGKYKLELKF